MKLWKWFLKCPMLFLLLAGWIGLTAFTWSEDRMPQKLGWELVETPVFTALLEPEVPDEILDDPDFEEEDTVLASSSNPQQAANSKDQNQTAGNGADHADARDQDSGQADTKNPLSDPDEDRTDGKHSGNQTVKDEKHTAGNSEKGTKDHADQTAEAQEQEIGVTEFVEYTKKKTDSRYYSDPGKKALTTDFSYQKVDQDYFDDAVFIGDSRTVGMQDYSGLENAQFFAKTGMNVYDVLEDPFLTDPKTGEQVSVAHMLKTYHYGKIYFMVGINELGTGNTGTFQKAYARVLQKFRKWQPEAVIYIQGIIPVSKAKASEDEIFNNININDKNVAIAQLADGKDIFYLDVSKKLTDKGGYLKEDYTFDEVHMYAQYYQLWTDFLMKHAVVR